MARQYVPITMRALIQRINRKIASDHEQLHATRPGGRAQLDLGEYYVRDTYRNFIAETHVDPIEKARELGVLAEWERVLDE